MNEQNLLMKSVKKHKRNEMRTDTESVMYDADNWFFCERCNGTNNPN